MTPNRQLARGTGPHAAPLAAAIDFARALARREAAAMMARHCPDSPPSPKGPAK